MRRIYNQPGVYIEKILYDPFQLAQSMQTLVSAGLPCEEYAQTQGNLTEATEALYSVLTTKGIRLYNAPDLRELVLNAVSVETAQRNQVIQAKN